jgi:methionyl-tRNA formyltransferase
MTFVFMGAPDFSTIVLDHLEAAGRRPALVVTQPDRPCGRGQRTRPTPVARWADARSIPVFKPTSCRDAGLRAALEQVAPDVIVTAAFGQILPKALLEMPKVGCLNVHASLLPKYRGASPIQAVLLNGESETGVTLMQMDEGLDTGPIVDRVVVALDDVIDAGELHDRLAHAGGELLVDRMDAYVRGDVTLTPQDEARATVTRPIQKQDAEIDFTKSAIDVHNHIRAMHPWPGAFAFLEGERFKIHRAAVWTGEPLDGRPGRLHVSDHRMAVVCGDGAIELLKIQPPSRKAVACDECAHNYADGILFTCKG